MLTYIGAGFVPKTRTPGCPNSTPRRALGFNHDNGERYLSIEGFLPA